MQRLLNRASWDTLAAMSEVRRFAAAGLAEAARRGRRRGGLVIAAIDETGQEKAGECTAGVKRQYMGCAGRVANGINTVLRHEAQVLYPSHSEERLEVNLWI
jgi:SRSO17 transposase